ncbi:MAG: hypothetical protein Q9224_007370, partial [Gallowayella concinna]
GRIRPYNPTAVLPNFRLTVAAAVRSIHEQFPHAQLHRIEGTSTCGPVRDPRGLTDLRLIFADPSALFNPAILLASRPHATAWGQWSPPQVLHDHRPREELQLGDVLTSDIAQVVDTMRRAGYSAPFDAVDVVKELEMTEVWWMFQMQGRGQGWIWVGDESGRVEVENHGTRANTSQSASAVRSSASIFCENHQVQGPLNRFVALAKVSAETLAQYGVHKR